jgi:hypothetical protein
MKTQMQAWIENCWFDSSLSGDGVEIRADKDQILLMRENSAEHVEFTVEEWNEVVDFVAKELNRYADTNS